MTISDIAITYVRSPAAIHERLRAVASPRRAPSYHQPPTDGQHAAQVHTLVFPSRNSNFCPGRNRSGTAADVRPMSLIACYRRTFYELKLNCRAVARSENALRIILDLDDAHCLSYGLSRIRRKWLPPVQPKPCQRSHHNEA